ncbi:MAG: hypothetical protein ACLTSX_08715 [Collinsella sp.]
MAAYKEAYGEVPDQFAADAYDSVHAVALALAEIGLGADADPAEVADALPAGYDQDHRRGPYRHAHLERQGRGREGDHRVRHQGRQVRPGVRCSR